MMAYPNAKSSLPGKHRDVPCVGIECDLCNEKHCPELVTVIDTVKVCGTCEYVLSRIPGHVITGGMAPT